MLLPICLVTVQLVGSAVAQVQGISCSRHWGRVPSSRELVPDEIDSAEQGGLEALLIAMQLYMPMKQHNQLCMQGPRG